ncbi:hypothetical protein PENSPDRAFT_754051 [Peniophora sp. CONT]|nr:hypothetical protein PENSPDRAFT_754051 [Peniophora sp. CONT]
MDSNGFDFFGHSNFMPPASDSDKQSTDPNPITDTDFQALLDFLPATGQFDVQPLADYDHTPWVEPAFGNASDPFPEIPLSATAAGTEGVFTNDSSAAQGEYDVNHHMQDYPGLQQLSPSSNAPSMTNGTTRSSSNDPSTPGANELGAFGATHSSDGPFRSAAAVASAEAAPQPTMPLGSLSGSTNNNNRVRFGYDGMPVQAAGFEHHDAGHTQPFPHAWQGNLGTHSHSQGLNAASELSAPAFGQPSYDWPAATAPPPPWSTQGPYDAIPSSLERPDVAPQGGVHHNNTRLQRRDEPYYTNQAAASGAHLGRNNTISTDAAPTGGARSKGAGRTTLPRPRTTKKKANLTARRRKSSAPKKSSASAKKKRTKAPEHERVCRVKDCHPPRVKKRWNNFPLFAEKSSLVRHLLRVHDKEVETCPACGKKLSRSDSFNRHWDSFHEPQGEEGKDEDEEDVTPPDDTPFNWGKFGDDDDQGGFGGMGGMGGMSTEMPQQWASGQAGPSNW